MQLTKKTHEKRDDLQCWRAISILAVLLFHIWPERFPNGYLGVDIFFVLSGFLMASLYTFSKAIDESLVDFYFRRIKRILPIYYVVISVSLAILSYQILSDQLKFILEDSKWAVNLATNFEDLLKKRGYFETKSNFRFFRHCWSLAVEMQFYLIFPFIAIIRNFVSFQKYQFFLSFLICGSLFYQFMTDNPIIQYESLSCRIWQFSFGIFAQTISHFSIKHFSSLLLSATSIIMFSSYELPRFVISLVTITFAAGIIVMSSPQYHPFKTNVFPLFVKYLSALGDISYILYLIHWPIITYSRFVSSQTFFNFFEGALLLGSSIFCAQICHIFVEKPLLKVCNSQKNLIIITISLYVATIYFPPYILNLETQEGNIENQKPSDLTFQFFQNVTNFDSPLVLPPNWTIRNDIEVVVKFRGELMGGIYHCEKSREIMVKQMPFSYCEISGNPNATLSALVLGNSFSMNILAAVAANSLFFKVISVWTNSENFPMHDDLENFFLEKQIKVLKPNVTFIVQRYNMKYIDEVSIDKIEENPEFKYWNSIYQIIQNYTSAIILNKEQATFPIDISQDYLRRKIYNLEIITKLEKPKKSEVLDAWLTSLNCSKCAFFDYREAFCDEKFCNITDPITHLPLIRDIDHISPFGLRILKPFIDAAINKALKSV